MICICFEIWIHLIPLHSLLTHCCSIRTKLNLVNNEFRKLWISNWHKWIINIIWYLIFITNNKSWCYIICLRRTLWGEENKYQICWKFISDKTNVVAHEIGKQKYWTIWESAFKLKIYMNTSKTMETIYFRSRSLVRVYCL